MSAPSPAHRSAAPQGAGRPSALSHWRAQEAAEGPATVVAEAEWQALPSGWWLLPAAAFGALCWVWAALTAF